MDVRQLLAAILASPDDDTPRLVYADWLQERGDAQGELIAVQCALASMQSDDPARAGLVDRETELLVDHRHRWLSVLKLTGATCTFRRGFVEEVTLGAKKFLELHTSLFRALPLQTLSLLRAGEQDPARWAAIPEMARLRALDLSKACWLHPRGAVALASCPTLTGLRRLDVSNNALGDTGTDAVLASTPLAGLRCLDLGANGLRDLDTAGFALQRLESLSLRDNPLVPSALASLGRLDLSELVSLDLTSTALDQDAIGPLKPLLGRLRKLSVAGSALGDAGIAVLARAATRLEELAAGLMGLGPAGASAIARSAWRLTSLSLPSNDLGPQGAETIATMKPSLRALDLGANQLGDDGAALLAASPSLSLCTTLALERNAIGPRGAAALAGSPHLANLRELYLNDNAIGCDGVLALARSPHLGRLRQLNLYANGVKNDGGMALAKSQNLGSLVDLNLEGEGNTVGRPALRALRGRYGAGLQY